MNRAEDDGGPGEARRSGGRGAPRRARARAARVRRGAVRDRAAVEDLVQDTFAAALDRGVPPSGPGDVGRWLFAIARNKALKHMLPCEDATMDSSDPFVLGDPTDAPREEALRGGDLRFRTKRGLRPTERLLIDALPEKPPGRFLCGLDSEGSPALAARALWGDAPAVVWWHLDAYVAAKAARTLARHHVRVDERCAADLPGAQVPGEDPPADGPFDLIALPFPRGGEAQFGREVIEESHAALAPGGRLLAATDDRKGEWVNKVLRDVFGNSTIAHQEKRTGVCLGAKRTKARAEVRDHRHRMKLTLRGRAVELDGRPGVFGYRGLDAGTRVLADGVEVRPGDVALDLGCGVGALGLAVAPECARVVLVDSNARAVALATRNAALARAANVEVLLRADLEELGGPAFDLALANPPYFANFRIARAFVAAAASALRPGGRLWLVAKAGEEHEAIVAERFRDVARTEAPSGHWLIRGVVP
jgi:16S rRNA (guanine1207-N2)-methyltransferase